MPRAVFTPINPHDLSSEARAAIGRQMRGRFDPCPRGLQVECNGRRVRAIWSRVFDRPLTETFHEFVVNVLKWTLGEKWYMKQVRAPDDQRHVVMRWIYAWHALAREATPPDHIKGRRFESVPTGSATSLLMLADDLYRLQLARRLPDRLVQKLRDRREFQGVRYEIAVASMFVRAGCDVEWIAEDSPGKTCEFTATGPRGLVVAVEVKSRRRPGTLNEPGEPPAEWRTDVDNLYRKAIEKDPGGHPLVVFIDVNRPPERDMPPGHKEWQRDVMAMIGRLPLNSPMEPAREALLVLTNFGWHYEAYAVAGPVEHMFVVPKWSHHRIAAERVVEWLAQQLDSYGATPRDE